MKIITVMLLVLLCGCSARPPEAKQHNDYNVVIILVDAMRFDHLGAYGYFKDTSPNIDRISQESLVFENAISQAASTRMAVTSLFTSQYVDHCKDAPENYVLPSTARTLAEVLAAKGYRTIGIQDNVMVGPGSGLEQGFGAYETVGGDENKTARAVDWVEKNGRQKFFMYIHYMAPHADYYPPEEFRVKFKSNYTGTIDFKGKHQRALNQMSLTQEDIEELRSRYDGEIGFIDAEIRKFVTYLKENALLEKTILIIMADHGEALAEKRMIGHGLLYNVVLQVPLIVRLPGASYAQRVASVVEIIDIAPSILARLNIAIPSVFQGGNIFDVDRIKEKYGFSQHKDERVMIRSKKYAFKTDGHDVALFDLSQDPFELTDISQSDPAQIRDFMAAYGVFRDRKDKVKMKRKALQADRIDQLKALGYLQ